MVVALHSCSGLEVKPVLVGGTVMWEKFDFFFFSYEVFNLLIVASVMLFRLLFMFKKNGDHELCNYEMMLW